VPIGALASLKYFIPELPLVLTLGFVLVWDLILMGHKDRGRLIPLLTIAGLFLAGYFTIELRHAPEGGLFSGMVALDRFGIALRLLFVVTAILITLLAIPSRELGSVHKGELYALLLAATLALMWMASSINLLMIYLSLETVSIISYIMVGYLRRERLSNEASLKYVVFGAVSTGTMLYGMSFLFGLTGSLDLFEIRAALQNGAAGDAGPTLLLVVILILAGIGFKTAAVPFHFWCPDVYTGAPTPVTAFLSVGPKVAGFAVLVRFFYLGMAEPLAQSAGQAWEMVGPINWQVLLIGISIATMTLGNVAALLQTNLKRLLAYSSIAHAGYILMGAVVLSGEGIQAMLAYMVIYLFMNLGAFLVVMAIHDDTGSFDLKDCRGLWKRSPYLTVAMGIFLLSLMGIPPFAGFLAKLYVFAAVIRTAIEQGNTLLGWFAVIGVLNSVVAVFYYMKIFRVMFIEGDEPSEPGRRLDLHPIYSSLLFVLVIPNIIGLVLWGYLDTLTELSQKLLGVM
jgi:NADH-quinone oxidoreductase subunit N